MKDAPRSGVEQGHKLTRARRTDNTATVRRTSTFLKVRIMMNMQNPRFWKEDYEHQHAEREDWRHNLLNDFQSNCFLGLMSVDLYQAKDCLATETYWSTVRTGCSLSTYALCSNDISSRWKVHNPHSISVGHLDFGLLKSLGNPYRNNMSTYIWRTDKTNKPWDVV